MIENLRTPGALPFALTIGLKRDFLIYLGYDDHQDLIKGGPG